MPGPKRAAVNSAIEVRFISPNGSDMADSAGCSIYQQDTGASTGPWGPSRPVAPARRV